MNNYPENSEYNYLAWCIYQQRLAEESNLLAPTQDEYHYACLDRDFEKAGRLWEQMSQVHQEIFDRSMRKIDILHWLHLDTQLRAEGKTYADVMESDESN